MKTRFDMVDIEALRPHEALIPELLEETRQAIEREGSVRSPLLVEEDHLIILDGHHRYGALRELGCRRIPVVLVNYFDEGISVETWPGAVVDHVTKEDVVKKVLSGDVYPPKTTRHVVAEPPRSVRVKLDDLR